MKQIEGIWWTDNQEKVPGKLEITDENKITLVNVELDRTDIYTNEIYKDETEKQDEDENTELKYSTYKYTAEMVIFGHVYERKGDIRIKEASLYYTNLEQWIDWKVDMPEISSEKDTISIKIKKFNEKKVKTEKFNLSIRNPYLIKRMQYKMKIDNQVEIVIQNMRNEYIQTIQGIVQSLQYFLILCTGDNINVEKIKATDFFDRNVEIILGYGKSNYENRSILKNIVKYKDIEDNFENIIKNWMEVYEENELLMVNFVKLQTTEDTIVSEYMNLMSAIDSLHLLITHKEQSKDSCAEIVKKLLRETNFILNLSEKEIEELAIKVKDVRRYFVHSNKTQKQIVHSNISIIRSIMSVLKEAIRSRIMIEIGIDQSILEKYYKNIEKLKNVKYDIVNNINEDEKIVAEKAKEGGKIMNSLSKKDKENIAELNAIMGTRYRESEYDLENTKDLIEVVENTTAEYMDYMNYWGGINNVMENFDQSLEVFHPEKWFNMTKTGTTENELVDEIVSGLRYVSSKMYNLAGNVEERCKDLWKFLLLGNNKEAQKHFVGDISMYSEEKLIEAIEDVIENIFEIEYENQVQSDAKNFADGIKEYLEDEVF